MWFKAIGPDSYQSFPLIATIAFHYHCMCIWNTLYVKLKFSIGAREVWRLNLTIYKAASCELTWLTGWCYNFYI